MKSGDPKLSLRGVSNKNTESPNKAENTLIKPPERTTEQEIQQAERNLSFSFASDSRRVNVGYHRGKLFLEVEFYEGLPAELSPEEKNKFTSTTRIINGVAKEVYVLQTENAARVDSSTSYDPKDTGEFHAAQKLDYGRSRLAALSENRQALEEILNANIADQKLAKDIFQQVIGYIETEGTMSPSVLAQIPPDILNNIKTQIQERIISSPKKIDAKGLAQIISGKRIIFYTGAGISIPAGIPGMSELTSGIGVDMDKQVDEFTHAAATNPEVVMAKWEDFANRMEHAEPTKAHTALTEIAKKIGCQIVTANTDMLHEKAGIKAIHTIRQWQNLGIKPEWLKDIDFVVAIGFSGDVKGFLGWYRENNPDGKIVGADIADQPPEYLGDQDYFWQGNVQETLPELAEEIRRGP